MNPMDTESYSRTTSPSKKCAVIVFTTRDQLPINVTVDKGFMPSVMKSRTFPSPKRPNPPIHIHGTPAEVSCLTSQDIYAHGGDRRKVVNNADLGSAYPNANMSI